MRCLRLGVIVALGATACTAGSDLEIDRVDAPGRAPQIKDGFDDAEDTGVMAISQIGVGLCSGSLIAPNVILTARHCVSSTNTGVNVSCASSKFGPVNDAPSFFVTSAQEVTGATLGEFLTAEVVGLAGIPGIPGSVEDDRPFCGNDLAILILEENVPPSVAVPYEPLLEGRLEAGLSYYAVGYGAINGAGDEAGKRRRRDDLTVVCDGSVDCLALDLADVFDDEWSGDGGVCSGDSGGPALDLDNRVVGVTSRGDNACEVSVYGNPSGHAQWIKDTTVYASGMGLYEAPGWTEGATVNPEHSMPVGERCEDGSQCPTGICVIDGDSQYCSRPCTEDGPCPEGYLCTGDDGETICTTPVKQPPQVFKRAPRDNCSCSMVGADESPPWWLVVLGLSMTTRRRRTR